MKIDRLFQIIYILLERKHITAKELAEKFGVSTRTIYRDIDTLSIAGIPIYANKGKGGGIKILSNYVIDKSLLSKEEQNSLIIGLETLKATEYGKVDEALSKLRGIFNRSNDNWIEVDFSYWGSSEEDKLKFEYLKIALTTAKIIEFNYYDSLGNKTTRRVNPLKLIFKEKAWYLRAYCLLKKDYRTFKIQRINNLQIKDETFDRKKYNLFNLDTSYENSPKSITLKIILSENVKNRVYNEFGINNIKKNDDGSFEITFTASEDEWLYNYIISFGENIRIIEPNYINNIIRKRLEIILEKYKQFS